MYRQGRLQVNSMGGGNFNVTYYFGKQKLKYIPIMLDVISTYTVIPIMQ